MLFCVILFFVYGYVLFLLVEKFIEVVTSVRVRISKDVCRSHLSS